MTTTRTPKAHCTDGTLATAYEQLRASVLEGHSAGGHFGLVIVLREGLGAWMDHASTWSAVDRPRPEAGRAAAAPVVSNEIHADLVAVLANMTLTDTRAHAQEQA